MMSPALLHPLAVAAVLLLAGLPARAGVLDTAAPVETAVAPLLKTPDQTGEMKEFKNLRGPRGLILLVSRSVHW
jgi:hypothetical protein